MSKCSKKIVIVNFENIVVCNEPIRNNRITTGFQTFDTGPFLLSLQRTTKKIHKPLKILLV